jgi:hypothetical protein
MKSQPVCWRGAGDYLCDEFVSPTVSINAESKLHV